VKALKKYNDELVKYWARQLDIFDRVFYSKTSPVELLEVTVEEWALLISIYLLEKVKNYLPSAVASIAMEAVAAGIYDNSREYEECRGYFLHVFIEKYGLRSVKSKTSRPNGKGSMFCNIAKKIMLLFHRDMNNIIPKYNSISKNEAELTAERFGEIYKWVLALLRTEQTARRLENLNIPDTIIVSDRNHKIQFSDENMGKRNKRIARPDIPITIAVRTMRLPADLSKVPQAAIPLWKDAAEKGAVYSSSGEVVTSEKLDELLKPAKVEETSQPKQEEKKLEIKFVTDEKVPPQDPSESDPLVDSVEHIQNDLAELAGSIISIRKKFRGTDKLEQFDILVKDIGLTDGKLDDLLEELKLLVKEVI